MRKRRLLKFSLPALLMTSSCAALFQPRTAIPMEAEQYGIEQNPQRVVLLLPGIRDRAEDFREEGFISTAAPLLAKRNDTQLLAVDAHWGYYRERNFHTRIQADILDKHPEARFIWAGISLGGFGALMVAERDPGRTERLLLLSPFLGEDNYDYLERLRTSGPNDRNDDEPLIRQLNRIWRFLTDPQREVPITLAYGRDDDFAPYYDHLRSLKPQNLEFVAITGDHDWDTWRRLWVAHAAAIIDP